MLLFMLTGTHNVLSVPSLITEFGSCYYFYPTITLINVFGLFSTLLPNQSCQVSAEAEQN